MVVGNSVLQCALVRVPEGQLSFAANVLASGEGGANKEGGGRESSGLTYKNCESHDWIFATPWIIVGLESMTAVIIQLSVSPTLGRCFAGLAIWENKEKGDEKLECVRGPESLGDSGAGYRVAGALRGRGGGGTEMKETGDGQAGSERGASYAVVDL
jgi:hypothetical protein